MKILWLSHLVPYPPKGGVLQRSYHLVRELAKHHEVYVLAFNQPDLMRPMFESVEAGLAEAKTELGKYCKAVKFIEIPCEQQAYGKHILGIKTLLPTSSYTVDWLKSKAYKQAVIEWRDQYNFDLVHADTISLVPYLNLFDDVKTSLDHHNIESHMMLRRAKLESNFIKKLYFYQEGWKLQRYEKKVCPKIDINITCSALDSERLNEFCPVPYVVDIPNGVDINYFNAEPIKTIESPSLIFIGTLNWYPNIQAVNFIIDGIWPKLKNTVPGITIDIIGAHAPENFKQLANEDPQFRVHGFVDDVRPYFSKATIYICPITDGGGTKLKILDALAMSKAIVTDPIACEGINIIDNENVKLAHTAEEYIHVIESLLQSPGEIQQLGEKARSLAVNEYSFTSIGKRLSDVLESH